MSDTPEYILRKPLKAFVENDQYDEACYAVVADDGLAWQFMDKESFEDLFEPLDVEALRQQIADIMDELGDYRDVEAYFRMQEEAIDAVLRVCVSDQEKP